MRALLYSLAALAAVGATAEAGVVATYLNPNPAPHGTTSSPTVSLYNNANGTGLVVGGIQASQGGAFQWNTVSNDTGLHFADGLNTASTTDFTTFCIELTQHISPGANHSFNVIDLASAPNAASGPLVGGMGDAAAFLIRQLWANHFDSIFAQSTTALQNTYAAAFQLSVWKLEYDQGDILALDDGHLRVSGSGDIVDLANSWLNGLVLDPNSYAGPLADLVALTGDAQDQLAQVYHNPEPGSIAVWLGVAAVGGLMRRRNRNKLAAPAV